MTDPHAEIDRLVGEGQLGRAADLLDAALRPDDSDPLSWLKLAGLRRAAGQPQRALDAVNRALALAPLNFMALVMRAGLVERIGEGDSGLEWSQALAQRPAGVLPPPLAAAVAAGEQVCARWQATRQERLAAATASITSTASDDERRRIERFQSNVLRTTRVFHSEPTHFHFPGLVEREFHSRHQFPWLPQLEAATDAIHAEMLAVAAAERAELEPYVQYQPHEALGQWRALNGNPDWTAIHLLRQGRRTEANARHCPITMNLLAQFPQPDIPGASPNAMFSLLAPKTTIPPHVGVSNGRLVCHLPLVVPPGCWFRVGAETRVWKEGEAFLFDDTIEHEAANPSDQLRVVFIFDVWHPDLSSKERAAIAAVVAAEGEPGAL